MNQNMIKRITTMNLLFLIMGFSLCASANSSTPKKKVQEISFSEMDVQGSARLPDGTYLVQRRGLRFLPLYEVKKDLDAKIRKSTSYLK